jgi:hypothetical protein
MKTLTLAWTVRDRDERGLKIQPTPHLRICIDSGGADVAVYDLPAACVQDLAHWLTDPAPTLDLSFSAISLADLGGPHIVG